MTNKKNIDLGYLTIKENSLCPNKVFPTLEDLLLDELIQVIEEHFVAQTFYEVGELDGEPSFEWGNKELISYFEKNGLAIDYLHLTKAQVGRLKINVSVEFEPICEVEEKEVVVTVTQKKVEIKAL